MKSNIKIENLISLQHALNAFTIYISISEIHTSSFVCKCSSSNQITSMLQYPTLIYENTHQSFNSTSFSACYWLLMQITTLIPTKSPHFVTKRMLIGIEEGIYSGQIEIPITLDREGRNLEKRDSGCSKITKLRLKNTFAIYNCSVIEWWRNFDKSSSSWFPSVFCSEGSSPLSFSVPVLLLCSSFSYCKSSLFQ